MQYSQILSNKSFTYFWVTFHMVKFQSCSSLYSWVIATKMSKYLLSLKVWKIAKCLSNRSFAYFWMTFHVVKFRSYCSFLNRVIANGMNHCLLSFNLLQVSKFFFMFWGYTVGSLYATDIMLVIAGRGLGCKPG